MLKPLSIHTKEKVEKLLANTGDMALKRRARRVIEELDPQNGEKILDVGCGDGYYLHLLSNLGIKLDLMGADFDKKALESARKNLGSKEIKLFWTDLMIKLPFKDKTFDKIIMSEVAEHLPNDVNGLKEVRRVLKPGGVLVLTVPNANYPLFWDPVNWILERFFGAHIKSGFWAGIWNQHRRLYKPAEIKKVVEGAGFKIKTVEALTWWCLPFNHNLLYFAAKTLYGGEFSPKVANSINKFKESKQKPTFIDFAFKLVNFFDRVNNLIETKDIGVGVLIKGIK
jgi:2-polyprenyl-6-hydroxyphenyl methylase / 3-demethylubiquinone-9 3-methyltransferase